MTHAIARPMLPLKLISMQVPDTVDWIGKATSTAPPQDTVLLHPGQTSEIVTQFENTGDTLLRWVIEISGTFPQEWCDWRQDMAQEILPGQQLWKTIAIHTPDDFFEHQQALEQGQSPLQIDYQGELFLYTEWEHDRQLAGYQSFYLNLRPHCPYINFLPEIYQGSEFMSRFLTIFEQSFDPTVQTLDVLWAYLDPLTAPKAMLPFLSHWVAWSLNPRWELKQQRRLLRNAIELYRWRGTRHGLRQFLHLYTELPLDSDRPEAEKRISIVEEAEGGFVFGEATFNQTAMLGGGRPFHFSVTLRPEQANQLDEPLVRDIIEQVKPAFCTYDVFIIAESDAVAENLTTAVLFDS